jgi:hypothetical protein
MKIFATIYRLLLILVLAGVLPVSCTTASRVSVARPEDVRGLQSMGAIRSTVPLGGLFRSLTYQAALGNCLKKAESMGATHFVPDTDSGPSFFSVTETAHGTAFR